VNYGKNYEFVIVRTLSKSFEDEKKLMKGDRRGF
jgi:hypothetical protein